MKTAVALGSNVGDRLQNLRSARDRIAALHGPLACSKVYETEPVDCEPGTASYLNAVVGFDREVEPLALLDELLAIEAALGRPSRRPRNAPRLIDLDILFVGDLVLSNDRITIPHPRIRTRRFVLAPLCDLSPDLILPAECETLAALLAKLPDAPAVQLFSKTL